jgi:hypothetical protein
MDTKKQNKASTPPSQKTQPTKANQQPTKNNPTKKSNW